MGGREENYADAALKKRILRDKLKRIIFIQEKEENREVKR